MIDVLVMGAAGRMGREVCGAVLRDPDLNLAYAVDPGTRSSGVETVLEGTGVTVLPDTSMIEPRSVDVMVDFTHAGAAVSNMEWALREGIHCVVGTTGIGDSELEGIRALCAETGANVIMASNFALGAVLMMKFSELAAGVFDSCEIIERHHRGKIDAPSGTAIATARLVERAMTASVVPRQEQGEVPGTRGGVVGPVNIHSVRLDGLVAHQEVVFGSNGETLTVRHDTTDRSCFMRGVVLAVKAAGGMPGLTVGIEPLLNL